MSVAIPLWNKEGDITDYAQVDEADEALVSRYHWWRITNRQRSAPVFFAMAVTGHDGNRAEMELMQRVLLGIPLNDPRRVLHRDGNTLNNCRDNLVVVANHAEMMQYRRATPKNGFRGVRPRLLKDGTTRYRAIVILDKQKHHLGSFDTPEEAAAVAAAFRQEHMPGSGERLALGVTR